ncbi:hypothetical protein L596_025807 [Steinernema carpocapsae]|uniref:Uncharacterized protein n=1 Tax=Steinernema carpocapsae TaxID=34508 RepID=A0A4U5M8U4_STECR|nr:hypothetical protein L596_025807 [Steinernema carpocapsae]
MFKQIPKFRVSSFRPCAVLTLTLGQVQQAHLKCSLNSLSSPSRAEYAKRAFEDYTDTSYSKCTLHSCRPRALN